ncbi:hypothetical protein DC094_03450 [Pelagibaculum spongiae]|uniref:Uncharacterized protein n=1 Tax=Pelagibaculum spongiae TaxID=2080658 RepID=A0A2V1H4G4_9GAMM|nr:hypothetical protein DC094_03450 [Pelagibaculum spongiae]
MPANIIEYFGLAVHNQQALKIIKKARQTVTSAFNDHPYNFYRKQQPEQPLRPAPAVSASYSSLYEGYRQMLFSDTGYWMKTSSAAFRPWKKRIDQWVDAEWEGDWVGDQLALWVKKQKDGSGRRLFEQALENGIDSVDQPPEIMKEFFEQVDATPKLFDLEKAQKGADLLADMSPAIHYMANTSLIWVSSSIGPVSRMVGATGRFFDVENSLSRFVETSSYVVGDVSSADVFQRFSKSLKTGVRVRLMHSQIRNQVIKVENQPDIMDFDQRGHPMSMRISTTGGMMFSLFCLWFSASLGARYSREDYESCCELARVISYINGIDYHLLPKDLDECCLYIDHSLSMCEGVTPFTEQLNQAFYFGIPQLLAKRQRSKLMQKLAPLPQGFLNGINQWAYGDEIFELMPGMPKQAWWSMPLFSIIKQVRGLYLLIDRNIPGHSLRQQRRRIKHRAFSNKKFVWLVAKLMKRDGSDEVKMTYDSHDHSTAKDLKSANS